MCQETINNYLLLKDPPKTSVFNLNIYTYPKNLRAFFYENKLKF
jgi:hypothetical protein